MRETPEDPIPPYWERRAAWRSFRRSLKLTEETFPCYSEARSAEEDGIVNAVGACLRRQKLATAREATIALLLTFMELLATFIGERLTWQLLQEAWPDILIVSSEEKSQ